MKNWLMSLITRIEKRRILKKKIRTIVKRKRRRSSYQGYHQARKNVNKLFAHYFNKLKEELMVRGKLFLNRSSFYDIALAITHYVGLRYRERR
jgi:hypothetical protein